MLYLWYVLPHTIEAPEMHQKPVGKSGSEWVADTNLSPILVDATLAAEDKRFYHHGGVDIFANFRAIRDAAEAKRFVSGASTITQQTIKLLTNTPPRTLETKISEALAARNVEMHHDKETILYTYFSLIEYGNRTKGPKDAARHYFNKTPKELTLAEAALLAGLPQAPSRLNPRRNPSDALKRRNWVLERMFIVHDYPEEQIRAAQAEPLRLITYSGSASNELALKDNKAR